MFVRLSHVLRGEHSLGPPQNGILARVVRVILRRDLENGGHGCRVTVDRVSDQLGHVLVDEDDVDIVATDEALQRVFDVGDGRVFVHHEEVRLTVLVHLADAAQEEADARVLITKVASLNSSSALVLTSSPMTPMSFRF